MPTLDLRRKAEQDGEHVSMITFVDDRSFLTKNAAYAMIMINRWMRWSADLGLVENNRKICVVARTASTKAIMLANGAQEEWFVPSARILGVDFEYSRSPGRATAIARVNETLCRVKKVSFLHVTAPLKLQDLAYVTLPKATWGCWFFVNLQQWAVLPVGCVANSHQQVHEFLVFACQPGTHCLKEVAEPTAWAGELETTALGRKYNCKIVIIPQKLDFAVAALHVEKFDHVVALWFNGIHFDALLPVEGITLPKAVADVSHGLLFKLRGGGRDDAPPSPHTVWTLSEPCTVWTPVPKSEDQPKQTPLRRVVGKSSASSVFGCASDIAALSTLDEFEDAPLSNREQYRQRGSQKMKAANGQLLWKCPDCPFVCQASDQGDVCKRRYSHVKAHHGGVGQAGSLCRPKDIVVANPGDNPFWKCPLCCWGINREMRRSISEPIYYSERLRHRKVHHPKVAVQRWKTLCRKNQPWSPSGRAQRRVTNLNLRAAKRKLQLSPELLSKVVTFTWPHVLKRKGKDALSLMTMWMCRSCKCILPRVGKLKKHKCTPGHAGPLQAC